MATKGRNRTTNRLTVGKSSKTVRLPERSRRKVAPAPSGATVLRPEPVIRQLKQLPGADMALAKMPTLLKASTWSLIATFSPCEKTGTARYLDVWDADHFDGFTDMQNNLAQCRIWFSDKGYTHWDSGQTRTGRINCYFRAPTSGNYVCTVELQSHGGPAVVHCLIDSFNFGPLSFNGGISWPHPSTLSAGYHHFRIRQASGAFFFKRLTVWKV